MDLFSQRNGLAPEKILQDKDFDVISRRLLANDIKKVFEFFRKEFEALKRLESFQEYLIEYGIKHAYWKDDEEAKTQLFFYIKVVGYEWDFQFCIQTCRFFFEGLAWEQTLDILELLIKNMGTDVLNDHFNNIFVKIGWAYKVTSDGQIISTMDDISFESLEETLKLTGKWEGVKNHFSNAITLYKHRPEGKYKEACMASADALDKLAKVISNNDSATIETWLKKKKDLPAQIKDKALGIYHIRGGKITHANATEHEIDASFAKWYLVSCSALINWMIEKYA